MRLACGWLVGTLPHIRSCAHACEGITHSHALLYAYTTQVDQMSLGMRGQSDNGAIRGLVSSGPSSFALWNASRNALIGEVRNRRIEFATLVGRSVPRLARDA